MISVRPVLQAFLECLQSDRRVKKSLFQTFQNLLEPISSSYSLQETTLEMGFRLYKELVKKGQTAQASELARQFPSALGDLSKFTCKNFQARSR